MERRKRHREIIGHFELPEKKLDPTIEEAIKDFPSNATFENPRQWKGSKEYWRSVFEDEINRDPELHTKFSELHKNIVEMVIKFCEENGLENVDSVKIYTDGLKDSYGYHGWTCGTDSSMSMKKLHQEENGMWVRDDDNFLYEI